MKERTENIDMKYMQDALCVRLSQPEPGSVLK